jgi:hypothetical protein
VNTELTGMQPQIEIQDPTASAQQALKAVRGVVAEQGQVMSMALENNAALWATNKQLRATNMQLAALTASQKRELEFLRTAENQNLAMCIETNKRLVEECNLLGRQNVELRRMLTLDLSDVETTSEQRKEWLERIKGQQAELEASGLIPSPEVINSDEGVQWLEAPALEQVAEERAEDAGVPDTMPGSAAHQS